MNPLISPKCQLLSYVRYEWENDIKDFFFFQGTTNNNNRQITFEALDNFKKDNKMN